MTNNTIFSLPAELRLQIYGEVLEWFINEYHVQRRRKEQQFNEADKRLRHPNRSFSKSCAKLAQFATRENPARYSYCPRGLWSPTFHGFYFRSHGTINGEEYWDKADTTRRQVLPALAAVNKHLYRELTEFLYTSNLFFDNETTRRAANALERWAGARYSVRPFLPCIREFRLGVPGRLHFYNPFASRPGTMGMSTFFVISIPPGYSHRRLVIRAFWGLEEQSQATLQGIIDHILREVCARQPKKVAFDGRDIIKVAIGIAKGRGLDYGTWEFLNRCENSATLNYESGLLSKVKEVGVGSYKLTTSG